MTFYKNSWDRPPALVSLEQILDNRAIRPMTKKDLCDPFLLLGMREAVDRIHLALERKESIWIFGDYDVDGITSCAILVKYLEAVGGRANYYIPNRMKEGYGLSAAGLDYILEQGGDLVISVDCGINAFSEAEHALAIGLDLIITDHHSVEEVLPKALAVVNPKREGYPFPHLAGCGVALKLVQALSGEEFEKHLPHLVDIAAVGTVADIVSLTGENRLIVREGLGNVRNLGIIELARLSNKDPERLTSGDIGYNISPMINASGRIGNPRLGVELLLATDEDLVARMARTLYELNADRKAKCQTMTEEATTYVEEKLNLKETYVIVVLGEEWHSGIIGIVASRLMERYHRPVVVLTKTADGLKGSARSIPSVSIYNILSSLRHYMSKFGGHTLAAGLTLKEECFDDFCRDIQVVAKEHMQELPEKVLHADYTVLPEQLTMDFVKGLAAVEPYGVDNEELAFAMEHVRLGGVRVVGSDGVHVKVSLKAGWGSFDAIAFRQVAKFKGLRTDDDISVLFVPEVSYFRGVEKVNLRIVDVHAGVSDFHSELKREMDCAMADFLLYENSYHFTRFQDFDIIKELKSVDIYTYEGMKRLQEVLYRENIAHRILFRNEEAPDDDILNIHFMPSAVGKNNASGIAFLDFIPVRKDVEKVFLNLKKFSKENILYLAKGLRMTVPKLLLSLELLKELKLLEYYRINDCLYFEWKNSDEVVKLETLAVFRKFQREMTMGV